MRLTARRIAVGVTGAISVAVVDSGVQRIAALSRRPWLRAVARVGASVALVAVAARIATAARTAGHTDLAELAEATADGMVAGPVLMATLEAGIAMIPRRRMEPPAVRTAARIGDPWPAAPPWSR